MKKEEEVKRIEVKVKLVVPRELEEGRYINYAAVTHSSHEFHIFFAQVSVPPGELPADKSLEANTIAHVIVPPSVMPQVIKALSDNYDRYKKHPEEGD